MKTLKDTWENFRRQVLPGKTQTEMDRAQMAFYAGASCMFDLVTGQLGNAAPTETEDEGMARLAALQIECEYFAVQVMRSANPTTQKGGQPS